MVPSSVLRPGDAIAEQLTLVNNQLDQLVSGQVALAEQQAQVLRVLAAAEPVRVVSIVQHPMDDQRRAILSCIRRNRCSIVSVSTASSPANGSSGSQTT